MISQIITTREALRYSEYGGGGAVRLRPRQQRNVFVTAPQASASTDRQEHASTQQNSPPQTTHQFKPLSSFKISVSPPTSTKQTLTTPLALLALSLRYKSHAQRHARPGPPGAPLLYASSPPSLAREDPPPGPLPLVGHSRPSTA